MESKGRRGGWHDVLGAVLVTLAVMISGTTKVPPGTRYPEADRREGCIDLRPRPFPALPDGGGVCSPRLQEAVDGRPDAPLIEVLPPNFPPEELPSVPK